MLAAGLPAASPAAEQTPDAGAAKPSEAAGSPGEDGTDYEAYLAGLEGRDSPVTSLTLEPAPGTAAGTFQGRDACVPLSAQGEAAVFTARVERAGLYRLALTYYTEPDMTRPLEIALLLDGKTPFDEATSIPLPKTYGNENDRIETDRNGNELCPIQTARGGWQETEVYGGDFRAEPYRFYLEAGTHTFTLRALDGSMTLAPPALRNPAAPAPYQKPADVPAQEALVIDLQGELADRKSDSTLYPTADRSSPLTERNDASRMVLNTIGGDSTWGKNRQWLEWDFHAEKAGYYRLVMRVRQNVALGVNSYRRFWLDGEVPCAELNAFAFSYDSGWQLVTAGGEDPFLFYLEEGPHTLRLEVVPGESAYTVGVLESELQKLNDLYRDIVMITGATPDLSRDYYLDEQMPGLLSSLRAIGKSLNDEFDRVSALNASLGSELSFLKTLAAQLTSFAGQPDTIPERLGNFKTNISTLSTLMTSLKSLPLEVDYLRFQTPEQPLPRRDGNFFECAGFEMRKFFASFTGDYDTIGASEELEEQIEVWTTSGRDQAQIIKNLINNRFTPAEKVSVKLSLLPGGSIVEPIMAGKGPDVILGAGRNLPVNLAARGALAPLDGLEGFDEVKGRFHETAMVPYTFENRVYGVPDTQEFNMMFVRTDIFAMLGLEPPATWDEMRAILPVIVQNNLDVGLPNGIQASITAGMTGSLPTILPALLLQNGMSYYRNDLSATVFSTREGVEVFDAFASLYTDYSCLVYFDALNRFRTGEMPLLIGPFSTYNSLYIQAPEIKGQWVMLPIPGTPREEDGRTVVDISEEDTGTAAILLRDSDKRDSAWRFIRWWSSDEIQSAFAANLETLLGPAARYSTANRNAFASLAWSRQERERLERQRDSVKEMPEIPASYILSRNLANAFLDVVKDGRNARETIGTYAVIMDNELERKQKELDARKARS